MVKLIYLFFIAALISLGCQFSRKQNFVHPPYINLNLQQDPSTLDPRKGADLTSSTIHLLIFEGLTRLTPEGVYEPALAEKIEISEDRKTYTFTLRSAKWSDGSSLDAHDIAETWLDMLAPNFPCPNAHLLYNIKNAESLKKNLIDPSEVGIQVLDPKTLVVHLNEPIPYFLEIISFCVLSPVKKSWIKENSSWSENLDREFICNGAFRPVKWIRGREMLLEKNPHYWDSANVKLAGINFSFVNDEVTALHMYEMNELDVIGLPFTPIPVDALPKFIDKKEINTLSCPASTLISFNTEKFPFNNLNIRRAFALAINRKEIIDNITLLNDENGINLLPRSLRKGYAVNIINDNDIHNSQLFLKRGLEELNISLETLSSCISLIYPNSTNHARIAETLQAQWKEVLGVNVELIKLERKLLMHKLVNRDYHMGQCIWYAQYQDPMNFLERFRLKENSKNYPGFYNTEYINLLEKAQQELDESERSEYLNKALAILTNQMPLTMIYHWNISYLKKPYIKNLYVQPSGSFFLNRVEIDQVNREPSATEKDYLWTAAD
jgi:oligopeptide transport system substrate-binding protein